MAEPLEKIVSTAAEWEGIVRIGNKMLFVHKRPFLVYLTSDIKRRSIPQNSYMWGIVYKAIQGKLLDEQGQHYDLEDIHEYCKQMFGVRIMVNMAEVIKSTRKYTTVQMIDYVERIRAHFAQFDVIIPEPINNNKGE